MILSPDTVDCVRVLDEGSFRAARAQNRAGSRLPIALFRAVHAQRLRCRRGGGPARKARLLETFRSLADALGPDRVVWRYSPILLGGAYDIAHHMQWFEAFAARLEGSTRTCRISFLDMYPKIAGRMAALGFVGVPEEAKAALALRLAELGAARGIEVGGCGDGALDDAGLARAGCIDAAVVERVAGVRANALRAALGGEPAVARRAWTSARTTRARTAACTATPIRGRRPRRAGRPIPGACGATIRLRRCSATSWLPTIQWRNAPRPSCPKRRLACSEDRCGVSGGRSRARRRRRRARTDRMP